jgi:hypothetical protein
MKIFIPYSDHSPISQEILDSIKGNVIFINCTFDNTIPKVKRIIQAEYKFKEIALKETCDFYVYQQSDMLSIKEDNFTVMQKFLTDHIDFGAIALSRYNLSLNQQIYDRIKVNTILSGFIMFTPPGLKAVEFEEKNNNMPLPSSYTISRSLDSVGYKYGYVDTIARIRHLQG